MEVFDNKINVESGCVNLTRRIMNGERADYWNLYHKGEFKMVVLNDAEFNQVVNNNTKRQSGEEADIIYVKNDEDPIGYLCVRESFLFNK
jgi:hypothetical protein